MTTSYLRRYRQAAQRLWLRLFAYRQPGDGADAERKGTGFAGAKHGRAHPEEIQGNPDRGGLLPGRHRGFAKADLIAFGRKFIANPDLPERLRLGGPFNIDDPATYYGGGEKGYTDYPSLAGSRRTTESLRRSALEVNRDNSVSLNDLRFGVSISLNWRRPTPALVAHRATFPARRSGLRPRVQRCSEVTE